MNSSSPNWPPSRQTRDFMGIRNVILPKKFLGFTYGTYTWNQHTFNGLLWLEVSISGVSGLSTCLRLFLVSYGSESGIS